MAEPELRYIFISAHGAQETNGQLLTLLNVPKNCFIYAGCQTDTCMRGDYITDAKILQCIHKAYNQRKDNKRETLLQLISDLNSVSNNNMWCCFDTFFPNLIFTPSATSDPFFSNQYIFQDNKKQCISFTKTFELKSVLNDIEQNLQNKYILVLLACRNNLSGEQTFGLTTELSTRNKSTNTCKYQDPPNTQEFSLQSALNEWQSERG